MIPESIERRRCRSETNGSHDLDLTALSSIQKCSLIAIVYCSAYSDAGVK
jgi:hypothetical protein